MSMAARRILSFYYNGGSAALGIIGAVVTVMSASRRRYELFRKRLDQFTRMFQPLREGDLPAMHRTRVASRRLREILPVLELDPAVAARLGRRLKAVTVELGTVRELGVLAGLVDELQSSGQFDAKALRHVGNAIAAAYAQAKTGLAERMPMDDVERLARRLAKVGRELRDDKPSRGWQWAIDARVNRRAGNVLGALDAAGSMYLQERLHDVRIALKKFRYALEISCEAAGVQPAPGIKALKRQQDTLGRLHDLQILLDRIRQIQPSLTPPELTTWRKIDVVTASLEDECRRLHARFVRHQMEIRAISERVSRATEPAAPSRRAKAS
jgi:CHAD domain-containing protein